MKKVKILESYSPLILQKMLERFINRHTIIEIQYSNAKGLIENKYTAMVIYK